MQDLEDLARLGTVCKTVEHLFERALFRFDSHSYFLGYCKWAKASYSSSCPLSASFFSKLVWGLIALSREAAELSTVTNMLRWQDPNCGFLGSCCLLSWRLFCVTLCLNNSMAHFSTRILCNKMVNRKDVVSHLSCLHCQEPVVHHNSV